MVTPYTLRTAKRLQKKRSRYEHEHEHDGRTATLRRHPHRRCYLTGSMTQNPPFPSPEELKAKLSEFMKTNFGDKVAFTTYTEPQAAEAPTEEKPSATGDEPFVFDFLPRDIKAHLDRFVIKRTKRRRSS